MTRVDLGASALMTLLPLGVAAGVLTMALFRHFADAKLLRESGNRIWARLLEFRLFFDEPRLVLAAQRAILVENARFLRLIAAPSLLLTLPFAFATLELDGVYGHAPLAVGKPAVVAAPRGARLEAENGVRVEGPPVDIPREHRRYWRIVPVRPARSRLRAGGAASVVFAGNSLALASVWPASEIRVEYLPASILGLHWMIWFLLATSLGAMLPWRRWV